MMKAVGCLLCLIFSPSGANGEDGGFELLDRTSKELGTYLGTAVHATDASALERYNQAITVFGECLQNDDNNNKCLSRLEKELKNLDRVFQSGIVFAHDLVQEGLAMNGKAITDRIKWLKNVDTEEVELLEDTQGSLEEQKERIDNTINVLARQKEFSVDCEVEGVEVLFSDDDFEDIQVSFEAIINMALVRNGMDDYVSNFSWDDSAERRQTVRNLQRVRRTSLLRGRGNRGCRAGNRRNLVSDMAGRKLKKKRKDANPNEQTSGADDDVLVKGKDANPNEQTSGGDDNTLAVFMTRMARHRKRKALLSRFNWKENKHIDSIANPKDCLEGDSLNFVNDPFAYLVTSKLGVDITDNESFSATCCFHFDD
eukprot:scaffold34570_cov55-Attheya_sp.AAC.1